MSNSLLVCLAAIMACGRASAQSAALTYTPGSTVKLEQVIGDCDYQAQAKQIVSGKAVTCVPTASQTVTRFNILGNGFGYSFEDNGKMLFLFGDTFSKDQTAVNYRAHDPIAWSTSTDPEAGLLLNFFTASDGSPLFMEPPGIAMGSDDICNSGITLSDGVYLVCNTGADQSLTDPHQNAYSIVARFDETAKTFATGRTISKLPGGHFVFTALAASGTDVFLFGMGLYRASDMFLSRTPVSGFWTGTGTQYFAGLVNGQPAWTNSEAGAAPVVQDNPLNGPAWPNDTPTIGNVSVTYSSPLKLWLMTYDGGAQTTKTKGVYFTYAPEPWGPWSAPQLIFNENRDNAFGVFIHNPNIVPNPPGDGLNGPVFASIDPFTTPGVGFAPQIIGRFVTVTGNSLKLYYNLSTWNPYTVVKMRSEFTIASAPQISSGGIVIHAGVATAVSPGALVDLYGSNLAAAPLSASPGATVPPTLPTTLGSVQVLVNDIAAPLVYVSPAQIIFQLPYEVGVGPASVAVVSNGATSLTAPIAVQLAAPDILVYGNNRAIVVNPDGGLNASGNGAKPGAVLVAYLIGSGPLDNAIPTGAAAPPSPLSREKLTTTATVGNSPATVQFAGMTAGFEGLMQVNFVLPNLAPGDYPMQVAIGGTASNQPLVTVSK